MSRKVLDNLITKHYDYLLTVSSRVVNHNRKSSTEHKELLNSCFEKLITDFIANKSAIHNAIKSDYDFICLTSRTLKNMKAWSGNPRTKHGYTIKSTGNCFVIDMTDEPVDNNSVSETELVAENVNQKTKEYLTDLVNNSIPLNQGLKYLEVVRLRKSLSLPEVRLFDEAFVYGKSCRQISRETAKKTGININHMVISSMVTELREKIKSEIKC